MFYSINWKIAPEMRNQVPSLDLLETGGSISRRNDNAFPLSLC